MGDVIKVSTVIESIKNGSLSSEGGAISNSSQIIDALVIVVIKITFKTYDNEFFDALSLVKSVTKAVFSEEEFELIDLIGNKKYNITNI